MSRWLEYRSDGRAHLPRSARAAPCVGQPGHRRGREVLDRAHHQRARPAAAVSRPRHRGQIVDKTVDIDERRACRCLPSSRRRSRSPCCWSAERRHQRRERAEADQATNWLNASSSGLRPQDDWVGAQPAIQMVPNANYWGTQAGFERSSSATQAKAPPSSGAAPRRPRRRVQPDPGADRDPPKVADIEAAHREPRLHPHGAERSPQLRR